VGRHRRAEDLGIAVYLALLAAAVLSGGGLASALVPLGVPVAVIAALVALATVGTPLVVDYVLAMNILGTVLMRLSGRVERLVARVRGSESTAPAA